VKIRQTVQSLMSGHRDTDGRTILRTKSFFFFFFLVLTEQLIICNNR